MHSFYPLVHVQLCVIGAGPLFKSNLTCCLNLLNVSCAQGALQNLKLMKANKRKFTILNGLNGRINPGRMTLLLGPPGAGKSTLLMALAGKLRNSDLNVSCC